MPVQRSGLRQSRRSSEVLSEEFEALRAIAARAEALSTKAADRLAAQEASVSVDGRRVHTRCDELAAAVRHVATATGVGLGPTLQSDT